MELVYQLSANPYKPPKEINAMNDTQIHRRLHSNPQVTRLQGYVRTILCTLFAVSLFFTIFWGANASPFFAYLLLPIVVCAGVLWTFVEFTLLSILAERSPKEQRD